MNSKQWHNAVWVAISAAMALGAGASLAAEKAPLGTEASLPFASKRITNWAADGQKGIWIEATGGQWYHAEFLGPCIGVQARDTIAFKFNANGSLDRFGQVIVRRQRCAFKNFVTSAGPPPGTRSRPAALK